MRISAPLSDADLADLLRQGDVDAFNTVYSRYWKKLYVIASKRLHNEEEAEEIVQNIFLNLWRKRVRFRLITGFDNYFSVAVKFEVLDVMRKHAHASAYKKNLGISFSESDESTLKELDLIDLQEKIALTLSSLPEKCQLVFRLKHEKVPLKINRQFLSVVDRLSLVLYVFQTKRTELKIISTLYSYL